MANFNKVILLGNLTRDPELKYLPSNMAVCAFGLAVNHRWRDKDGNMKEEVCFVDVDAFGRQGETINQYMTKGSPILIEGRLRFRTWTGQDGQKHSKHSVTVDGFTFVGRREGGAAGGAPAEDQSRREYAPRAAAPAPAGRPAPAPPAAPTTDEPQYEPPPSGDDIPF